MKLIETGKEVEKNWFYPIFLSISISFKEFHLTCLASSGDSCEKETPDPIPNSAVKLLSADDTPQGKVGRRQFKKSVN